MIEWVYILDGKYKINRDGVVFSVPRIDSLGRNQGNKTVKQTLANTGYFQVSIRIGSKQVNQRVHRLLAISFLPNPYNKKCVNHINSNRQDNRLSNLEWSTHSENNKHAFDKGFQVKTYGSDHNQARLTWDQVDEIRAKYVKHVYTLRMISKEYNISIGAIVAILSHKSWKNEHRPK